jgi:hypothetical protein
MRTGMKRGEAVLMMREGSGERGMGSMWRTRGRMMRGDEVEPRMVGLYVLAGREKVDYTLWPPDDKRAIVPGRSTIHDHQSC